MTKALPVAESQPWKERRVIGNATLYLGDCLEILPTLEKVDAVITDPVWPNHGGLFGEIDAAKLLLQAVGCLTDAKRFVAVMRNDQNPQFLWPISAIWEFRQACWLRYAAVGHLGRFLTGNEVAYCYGEWIKSKDGARNIPAIGPVETTPVKNGHPCPRSVKHFTWITAFWSENDDLVIDPFMGSGTTGVACMNLGRRFVGIEIEKKYYEIACQRIENAQRQQRMFE